MFEVLFVFLLFICLPLFFLLKSVWIIPARNFAIIERLGLYNRTIFPGIHCVWWPFESFKYIKWTYVGQQNKLKIIEGNMCSFDNAQMDIPPIECISKDQNLVTIDGTLFYNIMKPQLAIYHTDDILSMFHQCAIQTIRNVCGNINVSELNGKDNVITSLVRDTINEVMKERGIKCNEFMIQNVLFDTSIVKQNQDIYNRKRQQEMLMEEEKLEYERFKMAKEYELDKIRFEAEKTKIMRDSDGMTIDQRIAMENAKSIKFIKP
jgi:regulator of protease activity HflC (stomatin/prohibitin superfamily)